MNRASILNPHEIGALVALVDQDRLSEAERRDRTLLGTHPNDGMLWKILSVALVRQGRDALQALRRTAELMPGEGEAHRNLGEAVSDHGQWDGAVTSLQRALTLQPHNVEALVYAANALRALSRAREAVPLFQRALELQPGLVEAHNNLGNAFLDLGRFDDAAGCYRSALQFKPDDAQILCNMGTALRQAGLLDEAAQSYGRALLLKPGDVDALNNLGNVLRDHGSRREAVALLRRAIEPDPGRADSHCNLGTVLFELRRVDEAAASYRQALALQPDYAPAHLSRGLAMRQQRHPADAESACRAALAIDPNYVEALSFLGELRADRGHFSEAEELFQRAIAINPDFSSAYASIATHRIMTSEDTAWLKGAEALLAKRRPLGHEIGLRYALGKYFDDVRQYDEAVTHSARANELHNRLATTDNSSVPGLIHAPVPKARITPMQRPPNDTCLAIYLQNFFNIGPYANDSDNRAHSYRQYLRITDHWRAVLPATTLLEIPYEALIDDQEGWTRRMLDFSGLPSDPKCLDFHQTDRVVITASKWQVPH